MPDPDLSPPPKRSLLYIKPETVAEAEREIKNRSVLVITTALALVAALFWQTALTDTIKTFIPVSGAWAYELGIAFGVTIVVVLVIYLLNKSVAKPESK